LTFTSLIHLSVHNSASGAYNGSAHLRDKLLRSISPHHALKEQSETLRVLKYFSVPKARGNFMNKNNAGWWGITR